MKPLNHAMGTERRHGGSWQDYYEIHNFFDSSKATFASTQHRALLHNELGVLLALRRFGEAIVNSDNAAIPVLTIAEQHMEEDVGFVPRLDDWLACLPATPGQRRGRLLPPAMAAFRDDPGQAAARHFGGTPENYRDVVDFFDLPATLTADPRARIFLHNSFGIWLSEHVLGPAVVLSMPGGRAKPIATREVGEAIVQARMDGFIHTPQDLLAHLRVLPWMRGLEVGRARRERREAP